MNQNMVIQNNQYNNSNNKSNKLLLIIIILLLLIIISVVGMMMLNKNGLGGNRSFSRTVMIYMTGSDLESRGGLGTVDLNGIDYNATQEQNINVLLIAGGAKKWHNDYIDEKTTSIYKLEENGFEKVKEQPLQSMGNSKTLSDFINYVYDNYKTDKYDLIFWNHGGAIDGSEYDELNFHDNLTLEELKTALSSTAFGKQTKLGTIFFNTCLNGTLEVANVLKNYSDYLVASEEVTLGSPYTSELRFINTIESTDDEIEIGKKFISTYKDKVNEIREKTIFKKDGAIYSTYSLIKLSEVDNLTNYLSDFFASINVQNNFSYISKVRANLRQYGNDAPDYDMVDLYNLVDNLKDLSKDKGQKVLDQYNRTVVYNWATDSDSRGMSIYFPYNGKLRAQTAFISVYDGISDLSKYQKFIKDFTDARKIGENKTYSYSKNAISIAEKPKEKGSSDFKLELTEEQLENFASAQYVVYRDNKDGYYKPIYTKGTAVLDGKNLTASIKNRQLRLRSLTDKEDEGYTLLLSQTDETDDFIKYETTVILQKLKDDFKMELGKMNLVYDKETRKIDVINVLYSGEDNMVSSAVADLSQYDSIAFSLSSGWDILDADGNYVGPQIIDGKIKGDGVITGWEEKPGNYTFELEKFEDGYDYYCAFIITDIYGNVSYSKLVKMN